MRAVAVVTATFALMIGGCAAPSTRDAGREPLFTPRAHTADGLFTSGIEGPATGPDGALYVVNFGSKGTIGRVAPDGAASLYVTLPSGSIGNGIRFAADGRMLIADYTGHRILSVDPATRAITTFSDLIGAHQPNDIAMSPDGDLYASDPDWATGTGQLWHITRDGQARRIESGMGTTNGVEVSPDGRSVYVAESVQRRIWVYARAADGTLSDKRELIAFPDHGLDGMRCDAAGNLYVTRYGAGTVLVVAPDGRIVREIRLRGQRPSNIAFGGEDGRQVFVTLQDTGAIETFRADRPGREYGQRR